MRPVANPVLPGFHPDPSILRVGEDYYIATSTFEWFPGVEIHHSRDLVHWRLAARPLDRVSQLDLRGVSDSGGVWAPCLSHDGERFHLAYTNVTHFDRTLFVSDTPNFLVTAADVRGPWSEPVYLNSSGFDPSFFHDTDGRKWLANMLWDHRKGRNRFGGIVLQEYSPRDQRLVGPVHNIFKGTALGVTEGPHLYKVKGLYYLIVAEGGTSYNHAVTVARADSILGPYAADPENPVLTSRGDPSLEIQKAGHASLVSTPKGEWYLAHLGARPLAPLGRCPLGRETFLQKAAWTKDGWLRVEGGGSRPKLKVPAPDLPECPWPKPPARDDFDAPALGPAWQTLRVPLGEDALSLKERPGFLRLKGRHFLSTRHDQTLVARRQEAFRYTATAAVEFEPKNFQQMAGLVCIYDTRTFYYLRITHEEGKGRCLGIISSDKGVRDYPMDADVPVGDAKRLFLRAEVDREKLRFSWSKDGRAFAPVGPVLDASKLSDEYASDFSFTGAFVGMACQDLSGRSAHADFDFFEYAEG
jgi:xylan 1,4-beta-xylosidase